MLSPAVRVASHAAPLSPLPRVGVPLPESSVWRVGKHATERETSRSSSLTRILPALALAASTIRKMGGKSGILRRATEDAKAEKAEKEATPEADSAEIELAADSPDAGPKEIEKAKPRQRRMPFDPTGEPGAMEPLGFFDPLGFCPSGDEGKFKQLRAAELKHGRVAMLASVGLVAQCYIRVPFIGLQESPAGYKAALLVPSLWMFGLVIIGSMLVEWLVWKEDPWKEPGNFGDPLGLGMYDRDMRNKDRHASASFEAGALIL